MSTLARAGLLELAVPDCVARQEVGSSPMLPSVLQSSSRIIVQRQGRAITRIQGPVRLSHFSEPQPDLVLLRAQADYYASLDAGPDDVLLLIEVADASLAYDHEVKAPLYAQANLPDYWILDLQHDCLLVFRDPDLGAGRYRCVDCLARDERIAPLAFPDLEILVADLFA